MKYLVRLLFLPYPPAPCPKAVGDGQYQQRQHIPCNDVCDAPIGRVLGHLPYLCLIQRLVQLFFLRQIVATPFANHYAIFQQNQSRVASHHGLQHRHVGMAEGIFGSCQLLPHPDAPFAACRKTIEGHSLLVGVFVDLVDEIQSSVIRIFQPWCRQQKGVALAPQYQLRHVLVVVAPCDAQITYLRFVSPACLHRLAVHKGPGGVGIIVQRELFSHAILLQDEGGLKLRLLGPLGYLHLFQYVGPRMIGSKIEQRQIIQSHTRYRQHKHHRIVDYYPLTADADESRHPCGHGTQCNGARQQCNVLPQGLSVCQFHRIAEASAVAHGVGYHQPHRYGRHHHHEEQCQPCGEATPDGKQQAHPEAKLQCRQRDRHQGEHGVGQCALQRQRLQIVGHLVVGAHRVHRLHESRQDKCDGHHHAAHVGSYGLQCIHPASCSLSLMTPNTA